MGDLESTLRALVEHAGLLTALGAVVYALVRLVRAARAGYAGFKSWLVALIQEEVPAGVKATLSNGGGDIVRRIVSEENAKQTLRHSEETQRVVEEAIRRHEVTERAELDRRLARLRKGKR